MRIIAEIADEIAPAHIEHGTDGNEGAESDHLAQGPIEHRGAERPRLADEGDIAAPRDAAGKRGVDATDGVHHAQAIGADEPQVSPARMRQYLTFQFRPCG